MEKNVVIQSIKSIKLLHVDDDATQLDIIKLFLNQSEPDMEVTCISDPEQVFEKLGTDEYHCLVTDYNMPKMNGIELAKKIRERFSIPIILYTGQGSEEVAEKAFLVGIDDYIRKEMDPSHYQVLANRIRNIVDKKQLENLYIKVMDQTHFGVCIFVNGVVEFANNTVINLFEKNQMNEVLGKNPFSSNKKDYLKYLETGQHIYTIRKKNREEKYLKVSSQSIIYNGEEAVLTFLWDDTEKELLEIQNSISQERFKSLVELSPDGIATFSTTGYMTFLNRAFSTLTGFSKEELLGKHLTTLQTLRKRDLLKYIRSFTSALQGNISPSMEFTYNKKDGSSGIGESHLGLIDVKGTKEMLLIARDITEKKKKETRYEKLFDTSPDGLIELDINENILTINETLIKQTGIKEHKLLSENIYDLPIFDNKTISELQNTIKNIKRTKNIRSLEFALKQNGTNNIWVDVNISPILFDNEVLGYQLLIRDITKRKASENEHRIYMEKLENLVKTKTNEIINNERLSAAGKAASMIGHDLRNPLQIIKNCIYILEKTKTYDENLIKKIEDQIMYSVELLDRFKEQTKTGPVKLEYISLQDLIEETMSSIQINENIEVLKSFSTDAPLVKMDGFQMKRVLVNIINNSIQAIPNGGKILITGEVKNDAFEISINDSGVGIRQEKLDNIFEPFYTTKKEGIGLGLSFCKSVIEEHGGTIEISSQVNEGTNVFIRIPNVPPDTMQIDIETPTLNIEQ